MASRWHRQPLLHFLLIGGLLFALHSVVRPPGREAHAPGAAARSIHLGSERLAQLGTQFQLLHGRPPAPSELQGLIESFVREEVLYREALSLGLDRDDTIVRRRMVQKMEYLALELAREAEPTREALQAWFDRSPERYRRPESLSFTHIHFSKERRKGRESEQASGVLALLAADPAAPLRAPELGDPFLAGYDFEARSPAQVERTFGKSFAQAVFRLEPGAWRGPVESSYGQHLVRVHQRRGSRLPSLEEVRLEVRRDWIAEGRTKAKDALYERLRGKYSVVVDEPAARQGVEQVAASATAGGP